MYCFTCFGVVFQKIFLYGQLFTHIIVGPAIDRAVDLLSVLYRNMDLFKMAVLCVLFTGLRLGELCALKWTDIDFENKILTVNI